jgi:hypothetical protein
MNGLPPRIARAFGALICSLLDGAVVPIPILPVEFWNITEFPTAAGPVNFAMWPVVPDTCAEAGAKAANENPAAQSAAVSVPNEVFRMVQPLLLNFSAVMHVPRRATLRVIGRPNPDNARSREEGPTRPHFRVFVLATNNKRRAFGPPFY